MNETGEQTMETEVKNQNTDDSFSKNEIWTIFHRQQDFMDWIRLFLREIIQDRSLEGKLLS